jgi:hypothetical protein
MQAFPTKSKYLLVRQKLTFMVLPSRVGSLPHPQLSYQAGRCRGTQHFDIQHNDGQHNDIKHNSKYIATLNIIADCCYAKCNKIGLYAECHYAECHYAECRGARHEYLPGTNTLAYSVSDEE